MIVVIQCAAKKQPEAGSLRTVDGRQVKFVANPSEAPHTTADRFAHPDDESDSGPTWRELLVEYNSSSERNPLGLYAAYQLYHNPTYRKLVDRFGAERTYILSAGWGLLSASYLTPTYDITFSPSADRHIRRTSSSVFRDFNMLPIDEEGPLYYFGGKSYIPQFCLLTARFRGERNVFYNSITPPKAAGCQLKRYATSTRTNWHYECANAFIADVPKKTVSIGPATAPSSKSQMAIRPIKKKSSPDRQINAPILNLEDADIRLAIQRARNGIAKYLRIMRSLNSTNVATDRDFQREFNAFYRVRQRSREWYSVYFKLLEDRKQTGATFDEILDTLWKTLGRYEPSFSSKLVATIEPSKPIWDQFVLANIGIEPPPYSDSQKLRRAKGVYQEICGWYSEQLQSDLGRHVIDLFDEEVSEKGEISNLKKLDFVLWQLR